MEIIRRKILRDPIATRIELPNPEMKGSGVCAEPIVNIGTFDINVMLTQTIDDMGMFTNMDFVPYDGSAPDYTLLIDKLNGLGLTFPFMYAPPPAFSYTGKTYTLRLPGQTEANYYSGGTISVTGLTEPKYDLVQSYNILNPFPINFDLSDDIYTNFQGNVISAFTGVLSKTPNATGYTVDADFTNTGSTGILYVTYNKDRTVTYENGTTAQFKNTIFQFLGEGWNMYNTSLSALTKEEVFLGIVFPPEINNEVFIERGLTSVMEPHLRLSEVENLDHLERYGNGYYKIQK